MDQHSIQQGFLREWKNFSLQDGHPKYLGDVWELAGPVEEIKRINAKNNLSDGLLKALQNQEAKTQRRIIQQKAEKQRTTTSKDW